MRMGPVSRLVRRSLNPLSTGATNRWYGGFRLAPDPRQRAAARTVPMAAHHGEPGLRVMHCVSSPGEWAVPVGERPGWSWLPPQGAFARLRSMPGWVRVWSMLPLVDRFAYSWMWWHGGWAVPIDETEPPSAAGVREPRRPLSPDARDHTSAPSSG
jgi:hypothetical protein